MDYEDLFDNAPCGYLLLDDAGAVLRANRTFLAWTGWTAEALHGTSLARVLPVGDRVLHATGWSAQLHLHGAVERFRCHVLGPDRSRLAVVLTATRHEPSEGSGPQDGAHVRVTVVRAGDREQAEQKLIEAVRQAESSEARRAGAEADRDHQAHHDALTGLLNRTGMLAEVARLLGGGPTTAAVINLDHFRAVNDSLGHAAGDELLKVIASRLQTAVGHGAVVARTSADEFAVARRFIEGPDAATLPDSLLEAVAMPYRVAGVEVVTTASIGVAVAQDAQRSAEELLRRAGAAVHRAKARGRHRWELHDPTDGDGAVGRLHLLGQLRRSIDQGGLVLHYQPRLDVRSRRAVGVEALVRWEHPTRGMVPPGDFIGLAEQSGLIRPLGVWVLRTAVEQAALWARTLPSPLELSVNLSARQLSDPNLIPTVRDALDQHGLDPALLILEITETALMEDPEAAVATLRQLKEIGVGLAVDDFGTGYASLTYLRTLPLDELKIDRTFVDGVAHNPHDRAIVAGCIHLAHGVGLRAVAEGVETEEHHAALVAMGCDQAQGYLYRRPVPAEDLTRWVTGRAEIPTQATVPGARRRRA